MRASHNHKTHRLERNDLPDFHVFKILVPVGLEGNGRTRIHIAKILDRNMAQTPGACSTVHPNRRSDKQPKFKWILRISKSIGTRTHTHTYTHGH